MGCALKGTHRVSFVSLESSLKHPDYSQNDEEKIGAGGSEGDGN